MARKKDIPNIPMNAIGDWAEDFGHKLLNLRANLIGIKAGLAHGRQDLVKEHSERAEKEWKELFDMWCGNPEQ